MRKFTYQPQEPISIERLVEISKAMGGMSRREAYKYGKECGISRRNVDSIRQMLGYSNLKKFKRKTIEEREQIAQEYLEGGVSINELARKHGLCYNSVRCILVNRDISITTSNKWNRRQEMFLLNEYRHGRPISTIAEHIGKSEKSINEKIRRMKRDGIIKENGK